MFDIGWSELVVIGVVALIAIGPKELPGVLRMVGQWMGKVRRMASEFQGQFNEAMREAEMADLKKSFDEIKDTASSLSKNNILTSLAQDATDAMKVGDLNEPVSPSTATSSSEPAAAETQIETQPETHGATSEPLAITREAEVAQHEATVASAPAAEVKPVEAEAADRYLDADLRRDAKAS